jgi:hypothetical protein
VDERRGREPVLADVGLRRDRRAGRAEALAAERVELFDHGPDQVVEGQTRPPDLEIVVQDDAGEREDRLGEVAVPVRS